MEASGPEPYIQAREDTIKRQCVIEGSQLLRLMAYGDRCSVDSLSWNGIPFFLAAKRIRESSEGHKDLILHLSCNKNALDPFWRISFSATVQCELQPCDISQTIEQSITATLTSNAFIVPIMRMPDNVKVTTATFKITIRIDSWSGVCPSVRPTFDKKSDVTDATLIVRGTRFYVSRSILALHSTFFHQLFFNKNFCDAAKDEYVLDDFSPATVAAFLRIVYPRVADDSFSLVRIMNTMEDLEQMFLLAEQYGCDALKKLLMEQCLMKDEERLMIAEGLTLAQRLLLADRFCLSPAATHIMEKIKDGRELQKLGETSEYNELSTTLKAAILDMAVRSGTISSSTNSSRLLRSCSRHAWSGSSRPISSSSLISIHVDDSSAAAAQAPIYLDPGDDSASTDFAPVTARAPPRVDPAAAAAPLAAHLRVAAAARPLRRRIRSPSTDRSSGPHQSAANKRSFSIQMGEEMEVLLGQGSSSTGNSDSSNLPSSNE